MTLPIESLDAYTALFGNHDQNIKLIERELDVSIALRDHQLVVEGNDIARACAEDVISQLVLAHERGMALDTETVLYALGQSKCGLSTDIKSLGDNVVAITHRGRRIVTKTSGQKAYVEAMRQNALTVVAGPAGTGKTYLAMAMAVTALRDKQVERIILTRPAVEAGERLGFLPGDMAQKVDPYLRPLYDALYEMMGVDAYQKLLERGAVEVAPLAFMRGRTLSDAFIILDEAQNTTNEQMKMFLTRMGRNSRCVVTGDLTQIDLPRERKSGLTIAMDLLKEVEGVATMVLTKRDVVRNALVQRIVEAYEALENQGAMND